MENKEGKFSIEEGLIEEIIDNTCKWNKAIFTASVLFNDLVKFANGGMIIGPRWSRFTERFTNSPEFREAENFSGRVSLAECFDTPSLILTVETCRSGVCAHGLEIVFNESGQMMHAAV